jgi:hypothetical protein
LIIYVHVSYNIILSIVYLQQENANLVVTKENLENILCNMKLSIKYKINLGLFYIIRLIINFNYYTVFHLLMENSSIYKKRKPQIYEMKDLNIN